MFGHFPLHPDIQPTAHTTIVHGGTKDIRLKQSIMRQQDSETITDTIQSLRKFCILSGPIPSQRKCFENCSHLFSAHQWLLTICIATGTEFVYNFDYFWTLTDL